MNRFAMRHPEDWETRERAMVDGAEQRADAIRKGETEPKRFDQHQHPLTKTEREVNGKAVFRCERCGDEFTEHWPTEYRGCCVPQSR